MSNVSYHGKLEREQNGAGRERNWAVVGMGKTGNSGVGMECSLVAVRPQTLNTPLWAIVGRHNTGSAALLHGS